MDTVVEASEVLADATTVHSATEDVTWVETVAVASMEDLTEAIVEDTSAEAIVEDMEEVTAIVDTHHVRALHAPQ